MKAIIYARKSSESDEKQVQSIDAQLDWCREYAKRIGAEIIDEITEEKSAKQPGRVGFNKLMTYFSNGKADIIISWKLNRLSRNPIDEGTVKWLTQQFIIKEIHTVDGISNGHNILLMSVHFGMATQYLIDLSKDIKRGMEKKARNGGRSGRSPLGYIVKDGIIKIDEHYAPYIKKIFNLKFEQNLNNAEIARIVNSEGLRTRKEVKAGKIVGGKEISHKAIGDILANPFYYGVIQYLGEIFEGKHEALVDREVWDEVNGKEKKQYNFYKKGVLKGKVLYGENKTIMHVTEKIKTNKTNDKVRKYIYYHTTGKNQVWIAELEIIKIFDENIEYYSIPKEHQDTIKSAIYDYHNSQLIESQGSKKEMQKMIDNLEIKQRGYIDMRANGELEHNEFIELKNGITNEIIDLRKRLNEIQRLDQEILSKMSYSVELLVNISNKRKTLNNDDKLSIIDIILVELVIDKEKVAFIKEKPLFQFIRNLNKFHLVESTRFELVSFEDAQIFLLL